MPLQPSLTTKPACQASYTDWAEPMGEAPSPPDSARYVFFLFCEFPIFQGIGRIAENPSIFMHLISLKLCIGLK